MVQDTYNAQLDWDHDANAREQQAQFRKLRSRCFEQVEIVVRIERARKIKKALETAGSERTGDFSSDLGEESTLSEDGVECQRDGGNRPGEA